MTQEEFDRCIENIANASRHFLMEVLMTVQRSPGEVIYIDSMPLKMVVPDGSCIGVRLTITNHEEILKEFELKLSEAIDKHLH